MDSDLAGIIRFIVSENQVHKKILIFSLAKIVWVQ